MNYIIKTINSDKYNELFNFGNTILNSILPAKFINFDYKKYTNESANNYVNSDFINADNDIIKFVNKSTNILLENGFNINKNKFHVDFHRYYINNKNYESDLTWHEDDYGATSYNVNTIIYYIRMDPTIKGGNLLYKKDGKIHKINVENNLMILMDGRITHKPENLEGYGRRDSIVVQFKRI
jgi:hypothetical protein